MTLFITIITPHHMSVSALWSGAPLRCVGLTLVGISSLVAERYLLTSGPTTVTSTVSVFAVS